MQGDRKVDVYRSRMEDTEGMEYDEGDEIARLSEAQGEKYSERKDIKHDTRLGEG